MIQDMSGSNAANDNALENPKAEPQKLYVVNHDFLQALADQLVKCPYHEVYHLLTHLAQIKPVPREAFKEIPANDVQQLPPTP